MERTKIYEPLRTTESVESYGVLVDDIHQLVKKDVSRIV
ncbi:hypothetical protein BleG1_0691 [Shouchella lehensis G1]|uniref:Uncharacterized protein n=1 Tax=Shouchella lehensis G1 TaxID=1246626 RepID=A0A060LZQ0_9BACI|nr:hypothetical protein BleG1_0691 [Shouchella lehensis G1]